MSSVLIVTLAMLLFMALFVAVIIYTARRRERIQKENLINEFTRAADMKQLTIGRTEVFRNRALGMTEDGKALVYVRYINGEFSPSYAYLEYCSNFRVKQQENEVTLTFDMKNYATMSLLFYSEAEDGVEQYSANKAKVEQWLKYF